MYSANYNIILLLSDQILKSLKEKTIDIYMKIVNEFLNENYRPGMTSGELLSQYSLYGEDPFIIGVDEGVPFSAREYATVRVKEICQSG